MNVFTEFIWLEKNRGILKERKERRKKKSFSALWIGTGRMLQRLTTDCNVIHLDLLTTEENVKTSSN